jgi:hypothetical protein
MTKDEWLSTVIILNEVANMPDETEALRIIKHSLKKIYEQLERRPGKEEKE